MFAYCGNNPVSREDQDGYAFESVLDLITLVDSFAGVIINPNDPWAWAAFGGDILDFAVPILTGVGEAARLAGKAADGFKGLSRAQEFGIQAYNSLRKLLEGTGLQAHHIIEQRLVQFLDIDVKSMLSVAVTAAEHQQFTNAWRQVFKYGMDYSELTLEDIWKAAQKIYKDYPELLEAAEKILFG